MPKTYTAVPSVSTGDVYTATSYNTYTATNVSNLIVPPAQKVRLTGAKSATSAAAIAWDSESAPGFNTDGMWVVGTPARLTVATPGLYLVTFSLLAQNSGGVNSTMQTINIRANGGNIAEAASFATVTPATYTGMTVSAVWNSAAAEYFDAVFTFTGSTFNVVGPDNRSSFSAVWIGRTS